ncbi:DUF6701 domain-containing protein [Aliivibrio sp. EL58]|uniref:DUF6701 domain-containing protein n=1 Tax=Aliivibrio sp. EL58 TaxID=2107582 RepID=UPI0013C49C41|nr:DUF6701 domain-containing protein [Aliivibrio sp. EL58]
MIRLVIVFFFIFISFNALSMEFGRFNVLETTNKSCIDSLCRINFKEEYTENPRVFLMDSVVFKNENDMPSSLRIINITTKYVEFIQKIAPNSKQSNNYKYEPTIMTHIDYLIGGDGVYDLGNNQQLIIGAVNSKKYQSKIAHSSSANVTRGKWETIYYSHFSAEKFTAKPGIIHQVQSINNKDDFWLTSTVSNVSAQSFRLSLERSEIGGSINQNIRPYPELNETIAFVAAAGEGVVNGLKFVMKSMVTRNSQNGQPPVSTGCEVYANYDTFPSSPIVLANKNTRSGVDGGWLRRCRLEANRASFMIDEDFDNDSERGHTAETIGILAIEPRVDIDICTIAGNAAQSWDTASTISFKGSSQIQNTVESHKIGYNSISGNSSCDGSSCVFDPTLLVKKYNFSQFDNSSYNDLVFNSWNDHIAEPGYYNKANIQTKKVIFKEGVYWFNDITLGGNTEFATTGPVIINTNYFELAGSASFNVNGIPADVLIIAHGDNGEIKIKGNSKIVGFLLSEGKIEVLNSVKVTGGITSLHAELEGNSRVVGDSSGCKIPINKHLVISPNTNITNAGDAMEITFSIVDEEGVIDTNFLGNLNISTDKESDPAVCWKSSQTANCEKQVNSVPIIGGKTKLYLYSSQENEVNINVHINEDPQLQSTGGPYVFNSKGGFIFTPSPLYIIAGKPTTVEVSVIDPNSGNVVTDYHGDKELMISQVTYVIPSTGTDNPYLLNQTIKFNQGIGTLTLVYPDAGAIAIDIEDIEEEIVGVLSIQSRPHTFAICDVTSSNGNTNIDGTTTEGNVFSEAGEHFSVRLKPIIWTLDSSLDHSGDGKPDISSKNLCAIKTTPNYYSNSNNKASVSLSIPQYSATPKLGDGGQLNHNDIYSNSIESEFKTAEEAMNGIVISALSWTEVGSLWLQVDGVENEWIGGSIIQGITEVGRFVPAHFYILESNITNAMDDIFTYMGQEFQAEFTIQVRNRYNQVTTNYDDFKQDFMQSIDILAVEQGTKKDLSSRIDYSMLPNKWQSSWLNGELTIDHTNMVFNRSYIDTESSTPDGPYLIDLYLLVPLSDCGITGCFSFLFNENIFGDDISFGQSLNGFIDSRYGRLKLKDVGGAVNSELIVPTIAEYWDINGKFSKNIDDNKSTFDGDNYCRNAIYSKRDIKETEASLEGNIELNNGSGNALIAKQNQTKSYKEQVRLWLRLGGGIPDGDDNKCLGMEPVFIHSHPWLKYNWRGFGDEDPSAVVTFGIYRGNDRILFRGEPNMM